MNVQNPFPPGSLAVPSSLSSQNLLLDSSIRDWVVLPLLVIMIAAGLLRHYVSVLLRGKSGKIAPVESRVRSCLTRASRLRGGGAGFLSARKWEARRTYFCDKENGYLKEEVEWVECGGDDMDEEEEKANKKTEKSSAADDMPNPMAMMDGMKGNMVFMVQNMVMMQGISYFFQGYVLLKVPFPLTKGFKMMFQRGLDLNSLDTSYVSSVSWYFLVMFGLRAFFRLAIGDPSQENMESNATQINCGTLTNAPPAGQNFDCIKAIQAESENLELAQYKSSIEDAERRLLGKRYPKKITLTAPGDDIYGIAKSSKKYGTSKKKL
eukprot:CAMPEP_0197826642 /NCGR_PEP_ID=MMETSP1437-20131217/3575_1 /TAXON_ID=49252 ORGANISM="Eucampia antarctica, Strain CCMP1452" /NCGR_SAMPLE_ID=MMETSP1437 /ASSEMBLY_ACC=CAM_ASM_001096 /LENGTH=321 /DNA_ID=CAMNT_0043427163 /DNA_START=157 /DNA_END=1122 /DNA_ORIENTATION=+